VKKKKKDNNMPVQRMSSDEFMILMEFLTEQHDNHYDAEGAIRDAP
jgi:hypothetical protein